MMRALGKFFKTQKIDISRKRSLTYIFNIIAILLVLYAKANFSMATVLVHVIAQEFTASKLIFESILAYSIILINYSYYILFSSFYIKYLTLYVKLLLKKHQLNTPSGTLVISLNIGVFYFRSQNGH